MPQRPQSAATRAQRERILTAAVRLFGERGVGAVSIPELMATVGLTHGSFYWHFASKDDLACQACARALALEASAMRDRSGPLPPGERAPTAVGSASDESPTDPVLPLAGFALEAMRAPGTSGLSEAYTTGLQDVIQAYEETLCSDGQPRARHAAIAAIAARIGAEILVRAVSDRDLERRIATSVRDGSAHAPEAA